METRTATWTLWDAVRTVERSWRWMAFVTAPLAITATSLWDALVEGVLTTPDDIAAVALSSLVLAVATGLVAVGGGVLAVPCTNALGRALSRFALRRGVHVVAHAVLAGTLAALATQALLVWWHVLWAPPPLGPPLVAVAAGSAAAVATWRSTAPRRRRTATVARPHVDPAA